MGSDMMPFNFDGKPVRAIIDEKGDPWFVAKDVCDILGYSDAPKAIKQHCKYQELLKNDKTPLLEIPARGLTIINEPDLYRLMMRSTLPDAERFERKVMEEILPQIRKTGSYVAPEPISVPKSILPAIEQLPVVSKAHKALVSLAKSMGLDVNQAALSAAQSLRTNYRVDVLGLLALPGLESPVQERHLTPTAIGKPFGMSGRAFNLAMCEAGFQFKGDDGEWRPTDKGKPYAVYVDTLKKHRNGTPIQQLRWLESVTGVMPLDSHRVLELVPKLN